MKNRNFLLLTLIACALATRPARAATGTWSGAATGTWDTTATNWTGVSGTPWDSTNGLTDNAVFNTASLAAVVSGTVNTNGITFNTSGSLSNGVINLAGTTPFISVTSSITGTMNSALAGAAGLIKSGTGTLILTASNTYSGATTISTGTLQIGNGTNATAGAGTGVLTLSNSTTLLLNLTGPVTLANSSITSATSTATVQNNGTGKVTINNAATIAGTINGGTAGIVMNTTLTGVSWSAKGDVTLSFNGSASVGPSSPGATWHISANSSCWQIGAGSTANALTLDLAGGVTLAASSGQAGGAHYFNNLTGAGSFQALGNGGTVPNYYVLGNSTLSGTLTVGNNGLSFGNGGSTGAAGATTIVASSTNGVTFNSTTDNTYSGVMSGTGGLIKLASNTLTLTGSNTYTGNTTINAGTLILAANGGLNFVVTGSSNNRITGSGALIVNGAFAIDTSAVTSGNLFWTLVDATNATYGSSFVVTGSGWSQSGGVWTKSERFKTWTFTPASGVLSLATTTSLFVSPGGSDTNPGTPGAPMQTLAAAVPLLSPGNTLYLRAGTYRETLNPTTSGSPSAPITIAAYGNETAVITGCDQLTGPWTLTSNGIYSTSVGWDLTEGYNQVFVDGTMQHEAQYPNWTGTNTLLNPPTKSVTVYTGGRINSSSFSGQTNNFYAGSRFCGRVGAPGVGGFAWQTAVITSSSSSNLYTDTTTESNFWWPEYSGDSSDPGIGFVYGSLNLLDADGEWYLQTNAVAPNTLYLRITGSANPSSHLVEVKHRNWCITLTGNYVTVSGVQTRAGAIQISGTGNVLDNCDAGYLSHFMTWADANNNPGGNNTEGRGISVSGTGNTVCNCTIHDTSGSGITLTGNSSLITRNLIYNTDYSGTYAASLFVYSGADDIITFNTMHDTGREVLRPFGSGLSVMYNELYNASILCMDAGVIYAISVDGRDASGTDTRIAYNWLHDIYNPGGDYRSPHIYFDRYCQDFLVDHNVCWNNSGDNGIRLNWPNMQMRCYNNTLFNCANFGAHDYKWTGPYKTGWTGWTSTAYPETLTNNLYLSSTPQTQLVNWASDDFRLLSSATTSIDKGVTITSDTSGINITYGYAGAKPDLGAYEYAGAYWMPGIDGWAVEEPAIQAAGATSVSSTTATCSGTLISAGLSTSTVQLFWGLVDGGTSTGGWANQMTVNTGYSGNFISVTQSLTGLSSGTLYYYRLRATNTNGESWSDAFTFQTIPNPTILLSWSAGSRTNLNVQIPTLTGFTYKLESTTSLLPPVVWTPVSTNAGTGALMTNTVVVAPSAKTMFFHYVVTPQ